jgi:hypothetical protein
MLLSVECSPSISMNHGDKTEKCDYKNSERLFSVLGRVGRMQHRASHASVFPLWNTKYEVWRLEGKS